MQFDDHVWMPPAAEVCSLTETARMLHVTEADVLEMTARGALKVAAVRPRRYRRADVEALRIRMAERPGPADVPPFNPNPVRSPSTSQ